MIETRRLKNVVIFVQTILSFVLSRKIINIYNDIARKYGNVTLRFYYENCSIVAYTEKYCTMHQETMKRTITYIIV